MPELGHAPAAYAEPQATSAPVTVWNREIVVLRAPFEQMSPADRAASVAPRIPAIPENLPEYRVEAKQATLGDYNGAWIMVNGQTVFGLLTGDADLQAGKTFDRWNIGHWSNRLPQDRLQSDQNNRPR